jgi:hypothetical protein
MILLLTLPGFREQSNKSDGHRKSAQFHNGYGGNIGISINFNILYLS